MLKHLRNSRKSPVVIFTEFSQNREKIITDGIKFCYFFEGQDDYKYYCIRIENFVNDKYSNFTCYGKGNLLKVKELLDRTKEDIISLVYFIDRDFDDARSCSDGGKNPLYETPSYSIENFYIYTSTLEKILKAEFNLNDVSDDPSIVNDFNNILTLFNKNLNDFIDNIELLVCWFYLQRKKSDISNPKPDLKQLKKLKEFSKKINLSLKINNITSSYSIDTLKSLTPNYVEVSNNEIENTRIKLKKRKRNISFRGKYLIYFFEKFLIHIIEDANKKRNQLYFTEKRKCVLSLSGNTLSVLSQYAYTPSCLKIFLKGLIV